MHVHPAAFHPLTPGSTGYALLKVAAVGSVFGLKAFLSRRQRENGEAAEHDPHAAPSRKSHPVSARKARRRRKRRP